jgi:hypothetical protein
MSPLTVFLAKFFGVVWFVTCAVCLARPKAILEAANSMAESPGVLLVSGIFTMAGGVATVIGHNIWSGGALPVAVTLLGWVMLIKGFVLMALPPDLLISSYGVLTSGRRFRLVMIPSLLLSAWVLAIAFNA